LTASPLRLRRAVDGFAVAFAPCGW
jgi:hypothetical protein